MIPKKLSFKIILIGDTTVGKTSLLRQYLENKYDDLTLPTFGIDYLHKVVNYGETEVSFAYWDTAGQERFQCITKSYLRDINAIAFVFDISKKETLEKLQKWHEKVNASISLENVKLVLIGNKSDLSDQQEITEDSIDEMKKKLGCSAYYQTSAKENTNVNNCFDYIENEILKSKNRNVFDLTIQLSANQFREKECCKC